LRELRAGLPVWEDANERLLTPADSSPGSCDVRPISLCVKS
jgi:hypothetical protein